ncbi:hypothetical protein [Streptomyces sp. WMMC897]|uniref:hypothetical protein n=1 Tax=Streptomyces sp. WMMC897 TaxID=3014782 RepID=UPI0022B6C570|nr:hypothetical protein [Streptomyces sp. WMMC897]MCZ7413041.1 hypothetical protein [Streptomyces sp. WMMC897]MCZ7413077.1 hypothetical protein [Streptomyces sp. WMMC897]MCZ7415451.1 hypothetical protein [Streptomyces sp. WMMC897]
MQISQVRSALADAARAVVLPAGVRKLTCSGFVPDAVTEPHFFVGEYQQTFDRAMRRGLDEIEFTCRVLVGRQDDRAAQELVDAMLSGSGSASLKAAMEAARGAPGEYALSGAAHDLHVTRSQGPRWYEHAGTQYVGAEMTVKVIGEGA